MPYEEINDLYSWKIDKIGKLLTGTTGALLAYYLIGIYNNFYYIILLTALLFVAISVMTLKIAFSYSSLVLHERYLEVPQSLIKRLVIRKKKKIIQYSSIDSVTFLKTEKSASNAVYPLSGFVVSTNESNTFIHVNMNTIDHFNNYMEKIEKFFKKMNNVSTIKFNMQDNSIHFENSDIKKRIFLISLFSFLWIIVLIISAHLSLYKNPIIFILIIVLQCVIFIDVLVRERLCLLWQEIQNNMERKRQYFYKKHGIKF